MLAQSQAQLEKLQAGPRVEEILAAKATVSTAKAHYDEAIAGARSEEIGAARATVESAQAEVNDAEAEYKRQSDLYEGNIGTFANMDRARHRLEAARGALGQAREQLDLLLAGTRNERVLMAKGEYEAALARLEELENGTRPEDLAAAQAARDQASALVQRSEVNLAEMIVRAPVDGIVETLDLRPGDIIPAGPALRVIDPNDLDLTVYVSAALLGHLAVGERVQFTTDSFGDELFEGEIRFISSVGEFTPRNLQTEEDRVQQVFAVKIHTDSAGGRLRPGMAGTVSFSRE
jgi:HlyD family secretion protein